MQKILINNDDIKNEHTHLLKQILNGINNNKMDRKFND